MNSLDTNFLPPWVIHQAKHNSNKHAIKSDDTSIERDYTIKVEILQSDKVEPENFYKPISNIL